VKPAKNGEKIRKSTRGDEFDWGTLYACMGISQWNQFVQLICANKK
jgi:N-acetyl-anhydromuramyl-L-alanine amidase AmpD